MRHPDQRIIGVIVAVAVIGAVIMWRLHTGHSTESLLQTVAVKRADLQAEISATGTVEPEELVDVGSQVAGRINEFGKDVNGKPVDYGSLVDEGTVLAQIDDSLYRAEVQQAQANLASANANVIQSKAKLNQARQDWERAQQLLSSEVVPQSAYDQAKATFEIAGADVEVAQAGVAQAQATLNRAQRNLSYCTIKSPVKGVIIDRRVNIGQTVVASLNAPSLFLIAKDLNRIQVWVSVNEADIGNIHPGQPVAFNVDAFPGQTFSGQVGKVRLNAAMTQNVVTYTVEVVTDNSDGKLLPYLTANVQFITGRRQNVLAVPNAALHWEPEARQVAPEFRQASGPVVGAPAHESSSTTATTAEVGPQSTIWVTQGNFVRPVKVSAGLTDGTLTEVDGTDLSDGMQVVIGEQASFGASGTGGARSPFAPPQLPRAGSNASRAGGPASKRPSGAP